MPTVEFRSHHHGTRDRIYDYRGCHNCSSRTNQFVDTIIFEVARDNPADSNVVEIAWRCVSCEHINREGGP
jgi:hypothetical protein